MFYSLAVYLVENVTRNFSIRLVVPQCRAYHQSNDIVLGNWEVGPILFSILVPAMHLIQGAPCLFPGYSLNL